MSPGHADNSSARTAVAAAGVANHQLLFFRGREIVTVMNVLAEAACVWVRRDRKGERSEVSDECDEQQEFGDWPVHAKMPLISSLPSYRRGSKQKGILPAAFLKYVLEAELDLNSTAKTASQNC
jgi:hypothetical protein